ncbi:ABC-F family ATP-binding cassette domain-containing protein [candidate division FCPU426 bacterium]|nr:ABC-F family ATP-binding cassette domain-containing protein [candidate division FCPU426 bacterium]
MIKISNLDKSYGPQTLFAGVSFNINARERIGLVGRNGSGKTTLFRLLLKQEEPDRGEISIPKHYRMGYLEQHLRFSRATILEEACLGLPPEQEYDHWRAEKILSGLGFSAADMHRRPQEFSGGYQIRLNLTKTLVSAPDLLLLDEPTNYLDIVSIRWLEKFLRAWKREFIIITHDRQFMDSVISHTLGIHRCKVRKIAGGTGKLYAQRLQEETVHEKTRLHEEKKQRETELFIRRFRAKARLAGLVQSRIKTLEKRPQLEVLEQIAGIEFSFPYADFPAHIMLEATQLGFHYHPGKPWLIEDMHLALGPRERIAVIGRNGRGKSTLLRLLAGGLSPLAGNIRRHGRLAAGYFGQTHVAHLHPENTVEDELLSAEPQQSRERARAVAGAMLFAQEQALKKIAVLSGGEKSRVLLGRLLLQPSNLLLLDEPTNHLDMESCESLLEAMQCYPGSIVFVTHDELFLHTLAEKLLVFDRNRVLFYQGGYQQFLDEIGWENEETFSNRAPAAGSSGPATPAAPEAASPEKRQGQKRETRQERARIIQEKSKVLRPLEKRIQEVEHMIGNLEKEICCNEGLMVKAAESADREALAELPKKSRDLHAQVDFLFKELEKIQHEYDAKAGQYEKKNRALEKGDA